MIPRKHLPLVEVALRLLDEGATYRDVQKRYGVSESTLRRYKAAAKRVAQIPSAGRVGAGFPDLVLPRHERPFVSGDHPELGHFSTLE